MESTKICQNLNSMCSEYNVVIVNFQNKKQLLRLTCEVSKYRAYLEKILDSQNVIRHFFKVKELADNRILCLILLYEIIFGAGIRIRDKEVQKTLKNAKKDILFEVCSILSLKRVNLARAIEV